MKGMKPAPNRVGHAGASSREALAGVRTYAAVQGRRTADPGPQSRELRNVCSVQSSRSTARLKGDRGPPPTSCAQLASGVR